MGRALCLVREQSHRFKSVESERAKGAEEIIEQKGVIDKLTRDVECLTYDVSNLKIEREEYEIKMTSLQSGFTEVERKNSKLKKEARALKRDVGSWKQKCDQIYRRQTMKLHGTYELGYNACKKAVGEAHPSLDLSGFKSKFTATKSTAGAEEDDDGDNGGEGEEGDVEDADENDAPRMEARSKSAQDHQQPTRDDA